MEQKNSKMLNDKIVQTVSEYCSANNIENVDDFVYKCFKQGFDIEKYGFLGKTLNEGEKHLKTGGIEEKQVIKEVIVEKRVEVPVEVIKEIPVEKVVIQEVIKEVPIDRVIKKEIYITDDTQVNELLLKIQQLEQEISTKTTEIDTIRQEFSTKTQEMENNFQNTDNNKLQMLQQTITNLNVEIRDLKIKNKELENKILNQPKIDNQMNARFHGGSNLNDNLYR
jgi:uncharacterized protein (DUF3084 family)